MARGFMGFGAVGVAVALLGLPQVALATDLLPGIDAPATMAPGGTDTITAEVTARYADGMNVGFRLTLPPQVTIDTWEAVTGMASCTEGAGTLDCSVGTLAADATAIVDVTVTVDETATLGDFVDFTLMGQAANEINPADNQVTVSVEIAEGSSGGDAECLDDGDCRSSEFCNASGVCEDDPVDEPVDNVDMKGCDTGGGAPGTAALGLLALVGLRRRRV